MSDRQTVKITLTPEQQQQIQKALGKQVGILRLHLEELEARIAPGLGKN